MRCNECGSNAVTVQRYQDKIKTRRAGVLYWIIRWALIICTCGLWALVPAKSYNSKVKYVTVAICQKCGNIWEVR